MTWRVARIGVSDLPAAGIGSLENMAPTGIVTNQWTAGTWTSGTVGHIDEDPDGTLDGNYAETVANNDDLSVSFDTPSSAPITGADEQEFRFALAKNATGANQPGVTPYLEESATTVTTFTEILLPDSTSFSVYSVTWDAADLTNSDGSAVELRLRQTSGATGPGGNRRYAQCEAAIWKKDTNY